MWLLCKTFQSDIGVKCLLKVSVSSMACGGCWIPWRLVIPLHTLSDTEGVSRVLWDCGSFLRLPLKWGGRGGKPNTSGLGNEMRQEFRTKVWIYFLPITIHSQFVLGLACAP